MIFKTVFFLIVLRFFVIVIVVALYCGMHKTLNVWRCGVFMAFEIYMFSYYLIQGYNLNEILCWICFRKIQPSICSSCAYNLNCCKSQQTSRIIDCLIISLTSILWFQYGSVVQRKTYSPPIVHGNGGTHLFP